MDAVPIDKYFELFKPGAGGDGGFIRVAMNYDTQMAAAEEGALRRVLPPRASGCLEPIFPHRPRLPWWGFGLKLRGMALC